MNPIGAFAMSMLRGYSRVAPTQRGGYRLVRMARGLVSRGDWKGMFRTPARTRLQLDLGTYPDCCMAVGLYELDTLRLIRRILRSGDHFVDCGANIGYFTLAAAARVGARGRVDAFEPDPLNRARLEANLRANGSPGQIRVHAVALSDSAGEATLYHPTGEGQNHGEASLFASVVISGEAYKVATARLDEVIETAPRLIKMDIEGAELVAIKGMTRLLKGGAPPELIVEHNPQSAAGAGHKPGDLLRVLKEANARYRGYWVGWRLREMEAGEIDGMERQGNILYRVSQ